MTYSPSAAAATNTRDVYQPGHGITTPCFVYFDAETQSWKKAVATARDKTATHFAVRLNDNRIKVHMMGDFPMPSGVRDEGGNVIVPGRTYYLSPTLPGGVRLVKPRIAQQVMRLTNNDMLTFYAKPLEDGAGDRPEGISFDSSATAMMAGGELSVGTPVGLDAEGMVRSKIFSTSAGSNAGSYTIGSSMTALPELFRSEDRDGNPGVVGLDPGASGRRIHFKQINLPEGGKVASDVLAIGTYVRDCQTSGQTWTHLSLYQFNKFYYLLIYTYNNQLYGKVVWWNAASLTWSQPADSAALLLDSQFGDSRAVGAVIDENTIAVFSQRGALGIGSRTLKCRIIHRDGMVLSQGPAVDDLSGVDTTWGQYPFAASLGGGKIVTTMGIGNTEMVFGGVSWDGTNLTGATAGTFSVPSTSRMAARTGSHLALAAGNEVRALGHDGSAFRVSDPVTSTITISSALRESKVHGFDGDKFAVSLNQNAQTFWISPGGQVQAGSTFVVGTTAGAFSALNYAADKLLFYHRGNNTLFFGDFNTFLGFAAEDGEEGQERWIVTRGLLDDVPMGVFTIGDKFYTSQGDVSLTTHTASGQVLLASAETNTSISVRAGFSGTFTDSTGKTVTVERGLITAVV
jgi:hypothetical protein